MTDPTPETIREVMRALARRPRHYTPETIAALKARLDRVRPRRWQKKGAAIIASPQKKGGENYGASP